MIKAIERRPIFRQKLAQQAQQAKSRVAAWKQSTGLDDRMLLEDGRTAVVIDIEDGRPVYISTHNENATRSVSANKVWAADGSQAAGENSLNLSGSGVYLGIWDGGDVLATHPEFGIGRIIDGDGVSVASQGDENHANHVAGTMAAKGTDSQARGLAWDASLVSYSIEFDIIEMEKAANGIDNFGNSLSEAIRLSNHSYGQGNLGWGPVDLIVSGQNFTYWAWNADPTAYPQGTDPSLITEDYRFGFYSNRSQEIDTLVVNQINYLPIYSAGNDRGGAGQYDWYNELPELGLGSPPQDRGWVFLFNGVNYRLELRTTTLVTSYPEPLVPPRDGDENWNFIMDEDGDGEYDTFDTLGDRAVAKNNLVVASVEDLPNGWVPGVAFDKVSTFSSFGPPDDGRVKPDLAANGDLVYSATRFFTDRVPADTDPDYEILSGTSMASPGVTSGLGLVLELWRSLHTENDDPWASTQKAIAIASTEEIGPNDGPDYRAGWGLFDVENATQIVYENALTDGVPVIHEITLMQGESWEIIIPATGLLRADGRSRLRATVAWTDEPGTVLAKAVDDRTPQLVNDIDLRIIATGPDMLFGTADDIESQPWKLDPNAPMQAAARGDNTVDNVEVVDVYGVNSGVNYKIVLSRKNQGSADAQAVSLVIDGAKPAIAATRMLTLPDDHVSVVKPATIGKSYQLEETTLLEGTWNVIETKVANKEYIRFTRPLMISTEERYFFQIRELD